MAGMGGRQAIRAVTDTYSSPIVWIYSKLRFLILRQPFLEEIGQHLPQRGRVLDIGCGFGLFSLYFALRSPERRIFGADIDAQRIDYATESARKLGLDNVEYHVISALDWRDDEPFDAIYMLDLVHHLPRADVRPFLERVSSSLTPGGVLILKDVSDRPRWKMWFTLLLDRLMVGREPIHYWPPEELAGLLGELGFEVAHQPMKDFLPYPHMLYVARRRPAPGSSAR